MNNTKLTLFAIVSCFILLFAACQMPTELELQSSESGSDGLVKLSIRIASAESNGRTVLPQADLDQVTRYELMGSHYGEDETIVTPQRN
ncbi:MAG: hypothetical protein LBM77_06365 [Spirochaetaceae bacterium]|jgi:hypothetical protein|nr:hypothetical protein [Spirochaetaceae bacterium]